MSDPHTLTIPAQIAATNPTPPPDPKPPYFGNPSKPAALSFNNIVAELEAMKDGAKKQDPETVAAAVEKLLLGLGIICTGDGAIALGRELTNRFVTQPLLLPHPPAKPSPASSATTTGS